MHGRVGYVGRFTNDLATLENKVFAKVARSESKVESRINNLAVEFKRIRWMAGTLLALSTVILLRVFSALRSTQSALNTQSQGLGLRYGLFTGHAIFMIGHQVMIKRYLVNAEWDADASVWVATSDDVPGLVTESDTLEALQSKVQLMVPELLEANGCLPANKIIQIELLMR